MTIIFVIMTIVNCNGNDNDNGNGNDNDNDNNDNNDKNDNNNDNDNNSNNTHNLPPACLPKIGSQSPVLWRCTRCRSPLLLACFRSPPSFQVQGSL